MSRTIAQVTNSILQDMANYPELTPLLANTSKRSIWYLFIFVIAGAIVLLEQLQDAFKSDIELIISKGASSTALWLQDKIFKFQYDATTPQIVKLDVAGGTFAPTYDVIDENLRIVKKASINTNVANYVTIKAAKETAGVLGALSVAETNALQGYVNIIGTAGINYIVTSQDANQMYWTANIIYDAQYASVIKQNILTASTNYLKQIPFDGIFRVNVFEAYILQNAQGVVDLTTIELSIRENSQTVAQGTILVTGSDVVLSTINPSSGYIIPETTFGFGILDGTNITLTAY